MKEDVFCLIYPAIAILLTMGCILLISHTHTNLKLNYKLKEALINKQIELIEKGEWDARRNQQAD